MWDVVRSWFFQFAQHNALPMLASFIGGLVHDELPVAEKYVEAVVDHLDEDLASKKPLVAIGNTAQAAFAKAREDGITIGNRALIVAATNAVRSVESYNVDQSAKAKADDDAAAKKKAEAEAKAQADAKAKAKADAAKADKAAKADA